MRQLYALLMVFLVFPASAVSGLPDDLPVDAGADAALFRLAVATCKVGTADAAGWAASAMGTGAAASAFAQVGGGSPSDDTMSNPFVAAAAAAAGGIGDSMAAASGSSNGASVTASCYVTNIITPPSPLSPDHEGLLDSLGCTWASGAGPYAVEGEVVLHDDAMYLASARGWLDLAGDGTAIDHTTRFITPLGEGRATGITFRAVGDPASGSCSGLLA